jgi:hypothetical protein
MPLDPRHGLDDDALEVLRTVRGLELAVHVDTLLANLGTKKLIPSEALPQTHESWEFRLRRACQ